MIRQNVFILLSVFLFISHSAFAADALKIVGGPSSVKALEARQTELETAAGAKIEFAVSPSDRAMVALSKGMIFGATIGNSPDVTLKSAAKNGLADTKLESYEWIEFAQTPIYALLNPENSVTSLSKQQLTGILGGKIKNWNEVGGPNEPIHLVLGRDYGGVLQGLLEAYTGGEQINATEMVVNIEGMLKAVKAKKGGITFFTAKNGIKEITPKAFDTDAAIRNSLVFKKPLSEPARKVAEHLKKAKR